MLYLICVYVQCLQVSINHQPQTSPRRHKEEIQNRQLHEYNKSYLAINIYHTLGTMHIVFKLPQEYKRIAVIVQANINTHVLAFPFKNGGRVASHIAPKLTLIY